MIKYVDVSKSNCWLICFHVFVSIWFAWFQQRKNEKHWFDSIKRKYIRINKLSCAWCFWFDFCIRSCIICKWLDWFSLKQFWVSHWIDCEWSNQIQKSWRRQNRICMNENRKRCKFYATRIITWDEIWDENSDCLSMPMASQSKHLHVIFLTLSHADRPVTMDVMTWR